MTNHQIGILGLGYVGLPLAVEFGKKYSTVGFDISSQRVKELKNSVDRTGELSCAELFGAEKLTITASLDDLRDCNIYIVTVPTPINEHNQPDLTPLLSACRSIASVLKVGDLVIFESTVYPGMTEEVCSVEMERTSGLKFNVDFFCGYSPERINPGDKERKITDIVKITSGSTPKIGLIVDTLYKSIIPAGTYRADSIKVAEAAKVIENTQRDLNIGLMNELAIIFDKIGVDTNEVLEAAKTKWNFLPFTPGLVGGHCIGVDPYYLTHKAQAVGYHPDIILSARKINEGMAQYIASQLIKKLIKKSILINNSNVLIAGITFKENCPDLRNSKVLDLISELKSYGVDIDYYDPLVDAKEATKLVGFSPVNTLERNSYDAIVFAVAHEEFKSWDHSYCCDLCHENNIIYDLKNIFPHRKDYHKL